MKLRNSIIFVLSIACMTACSRKHSNIDSAANSDTITVNTLPPVTARPDAAETISSPNDTVTTPSGLKYLVLKEGTGEKPKAGSEVSVHYSGYLTDGSRFDSSLERNQPLQFKLGTGMVIKGWDEGIATMKKGGKSRLIIPPQLGYGEAGYPPIIPGGSTLIFDVELIDFK
jgi:peptidylprolyl isomerase